MKTRILAACISAAATTLSAEQVDLTNLVCQQPTQFTVLTWEFYDSAATRYYDDGSVTRLERIGTGAYEKYDREGEWNAVYTLFNTGEGVHVRVLARPGLMVRSQNPAAPMERGIFPFVAECAPIWESD